MRKAAFFRRQWIGRLELRNVASMVCRINLVRRTVVGCLLHRLLKPFADRLAVGNVDLAEQTDEAAQSGQSQVLQSYRSHLYFLLIFELSASAAVHRAGRLVLAESADTTAPARPLPWPRG